MDPLHLSVGVVDLLPYDGCFSAQRSAREDPRNHQPANGEGGVRAAMGWVGPRKRNLSLVVSLFAATLPLGPFPPTTGIDITTLDPYLHTQSQHHPTADSKREKTTHKKKQPPHPTFTFTPTISPRPTTMSTSLDQLKASGTVVVSDSGQSEEKVSSLLCEDANTVVSSHSPSRSHSSFRIVLNLHVLARNLDAVQTSVSRLISLPRNRLRNEHSAWGATGDFESESYHTP